MAGKCGAKRGDKTCTLSKGHSGSHESKLNKARGEIVTWNPTHPNNYLPRKEKKMIQGLVKNTWKDVW